MDIAGPINQVEVKEKGDLKSNLLQKCPMQPVILQILHDVSTLDPSEKKKKIRKEKKRKLKDSARGMRKKKERILSQGRPVLKDTAATTFAFEPRIRCDLSFSP